MLLQLSVRSQTWVSLSSRKGVCRVVSLLEGNPFPCLFHLPEALLVFTSSGPLPLHILTPQTVLPQKLL